MAKRPRSSVALQNQLQQIAQIGQAGKLTEAATQCLQLLKRYPNYAPAWHLFSVICLQQGQAELALQRIQRAIDLDPHQADFYGQSGVVHCNLGDLETGIACYQKALDLQPSAHIRFNLGLALQKVGRLAEAEQTYLNLIADHPTYAAAYQHLGNLYQQQAQPTVAIRYYRQALQHQPNATTWCNLGVALQTIGEIEQAQRAFQQALELDPNHLEAHNGLGAVYEKQEAATSAIHHYQQALAIQPNYLPALINLGHVNLRLEKYSAAEAIYRQILQLQPHNSQALDSLVKLLLATCRWSELGELLPQWRQPQSTQGAISLTFSRSPLNSLFLPCSAEEQQIVAQNYAQLIQQRMNGVRAQLENYLENHQQTDQGKDTKIHLGYVSGDFRYHAVGQLILRLFELHNREMFIVFAYSFGPDDGSPERQKFIRDCDYFRDMKGYAPVEAARQIIQDKIDILVDLAGHTNYACPDLFALRPAPLQLSYLGYPGTTGASYIDYIITDAVITPPELESTLTEACLYLPETYQLNCYPYPAVDDIQSQIHSPALIENAARVQAKSQNGLPVDAFVFCCFNKSQKLEPHIFAAWMRILRQVPNSVLWLLGEHPLVEQNLHSYAVNHGIDPNRLIFASRVHKAEHLLRHQCADLFLDTLYYNAHVTASDALWSGTPLITVIGNTFASRVAASLLTAAGISELITPDLATYEQLAIELATNPAKLQPIKQRLLKNRGEQPLFNTSRTVRYLEAGYALIWQRYQAGLEPAAVRVPTLDEIEVKDQPKDQPKEAHSPISDSFAFQAQRRSGDASAIELKITETITCTADAGFINWLRQINGSLLITTYQAGRVLLVGWNGEQVTLVAREFSKPMGAALAGERLALTTKHQLIFFANAQALTYSYLEAQPGRYDALYLPRAAYNTGDLHTHDLAFGSDGLWLVNTRFSCLAHVSLDFSFTPRWYPAFISELVPEDRCHLNGLAMANGKPQYVTALGESDTVGGWRANKATGGIVIDVNTDEIVLRGLSMPHSPRCYQNKLWLLNSGTGELWCVDPANWQPEVVCALPGFGRGLSLVGNYALVGLCQIREQQIFGGLPIQDRFEQLICGVAVVDLRQGQPIGFLRFPSGCRELYDVKFLPGVQRPNLLEPDHPATQEGFTAPEFAYWLRPSNQI